MSGRRPLGTGPRGTAAALPAGLPPAVAPANASAPLFYAVEIETYRPGSAAVAYDFGHAVRPRGTLAKAAQRAENTDIVRASDLGYRTAARDPGGPRVYPPVLDTAFELDAEMPLAPSEGGAGFGWGSIRLANADRRFDAVAAAQNSDGRPVRILAGRKRLDPARGIYTDPDSAQLAPVAALVAAPWLLDDQALTVPLRDATYFLEGAIRGPLYAGTGGLEGTSALAGQPKPRVRGGTAAAPVQNVSPVLVDPAALIYQYTDGPGSVVTLYEGADGSNIPYDGDVPNIYAGTAPAAGRYRTCNAKGVLQLGGKPVRQITLDCTGAFPGAGAVSALPMLAYHLMAEDLGVPGAALDLGAFQGAAAAYPYPAGLVLQDGADGAALLGTLLGGMGAKLIPSPAGRLRPFVLRAIPVGARPAATLGPAEVVSLTPSALPAALSPPTYRWRVGYRHSWTVQTSDLSPSSTAARRQQIAQSDALATWIDASLLAAWRRPNDPAPLTGALLAAADAQAVANGLGALWGVRRRLYRAVVPLPVGLPRALGDVVTLAWPMDDLGPGRLGQIVGVSLRSYDSTVTLTVLV